MDPTRRLLFWLRVPFVADVALGILGVFLLLTERVVPGVIVLCFGAARAISGVVALWLITPRLLARQAQADAPDVDAPAEEERPSGGG
jgi:hypothetical protein